MVKNEAEKIADAVRKEFKKSTEKIQELAKIPKCKLEFREGKAHIVCDTKKDQKIAYEAVVDGIVIEVKPKEVIKIE